MERREATAAPADPAARFGLIASAIGGRPLVVAGVAGSGWTDGRSSSTAAQIRAVRSS